MTTRYSQWAAAILFALLGAGILFAPRDAFASNADLATDPASPLSLSNIHYTLAPGNFDRVAGVEFSANGAGSDARLQMRLSGSGEWYSCESMGATWSCSTPDLPTLASVDQIEVKATH